METARPRFFRIDGRQLCGRSCHFLYSDAWQNQAGRRPEIKPENVSFDVTEGADSGSSDGLPIVFTTGYKVTYTAGSAAVPRIKPFPPFGWEESNPKWSDWLLGRPTIRYSDSGGLAVTYKSNASKFMNPASAATSDYSIPDFIPSDFQPDGKTYRQLTPEGPLPP